MSEKENSKKDIEDERKKLNELGVSSTWNILSDLTKKKKKQEWTDKGNIYHINLIGISTKRKLIKILTIFSIIRKKKKSFGLL